MNRHSPFVGRVAELAALEEALAAAILGRGSAVVLSGEPGIGKTRLASELAERAERRGARVLWARCATDAEAPAYWPFAQLLAPLYGDSDLGELALRFGPGAADAFALLGRTPPGNGHTGASGEAKQPAQRTSRRRATDAPPSSEQLRFRLFHAVTGMLLAAAAGRPLVVVFDDIHAADPGCLQLLVFLARALRSERMLVVATMRAAEARRADVAPLLLGSLAREALTLSVDGWTREEVGAFLAQGRGSSSNAALAETVHRASAGNPFFVGEIATLIRPAGGRDGVADAIPIPAHVRQAVLARIAVLPDGVSQALRAAAIVGLSFDTRTAAAVAALDIGDAGRALGAAVEAGFLERNAESSWSFRHEIARDVLYEELDAATRRRGHLQAATDLARASRGAEAVAHHLLSALPDGNLEEAVVQALSCARQAADATAYERAVAWLRRGLDAISLHGDVAGDVAGDAAGNARALGELQGRLLIALGDATWAAGDLAASRNAYEDAALLARDAGGDGTRAVDAVLLARAALGLGGRQQRAHVQFDARVVSLLEDAIAAIGHRDAALLARLEARLAYALYAAPGSRGEREKLSAHAVELARACGDTDTLRWVLSDHRWALWGPSTLKERRQIGEELLTAAQRRGDHEAALVEHGWRIVDALEIGDRGLLDEAFAAYRGGASDLRLPWYEWYAARFACLIAQVEGRLDDAERLAAEAMTAGERAGHPDAALAYGTQMLGVRLAQDRTAEIEGAVEVSVAQYPDVLLWRRLLARVRVAQDRTAEAAGEIERARAGSLVDAPGDFLHLPSLAILAELVAAAGDDQSRQRVHAALAPFSGRQVVLGFGMGFLGPVDQYLGELAAGCAMFDEARAHFDNAAAQAARLGAARWVARARLSLRMIGEARPPAGIARADDDSATSTRKRSTAHPAALEADGDGWRGEFAGGRFRVGALRGIVYLRALLEEPERELHVLELSALGDRDSRRTEARRGKDAGAAPISDRADLGDSGPLLDDAAKRAYRSRLAELAADLAEATDFADLGRAAVIRAEIEALEDELARAVGLGGRDRTSGAAAERARIAVAKRIRAAVERIGEQSPELQRYFEATIRTGIFCVYRPDPGRPVRWKL